jgi:hypothetical protein
MVLGLIWLARDQSKVVPNYHLGGIQVTGAYTRQDVEEILRSVRAITRDEVWWVSAPLDDRIAFTNGNGKRLPTEVAEVFTFGDRSRTSGSVYKLKRSDGTWRLSETSQWIR